MRIVDVGHQLIELGFVTHREFEFELHHMVGWRRLRLVHQRVHRGGAALDLGYGNRIGAGVGRLSRIGASGG